MGLKEREYKMKPNNLDELDKSDSSGSSSYPS